MAPQFTWIPAATTGCFQAIRAPPRVLAVCASGSISTTASRIQSTPAGMESASGRAVTALSTTPPPTRVHSGW